MTLLLIFHLQWCLACHLESIQDEGVEIRPKNFHQREEELTKIYIPVNKIKNLGRSEYLFWDPL